MTAAASAEILLCCLIWAREGLADDMHAYESDVLTLIPEHGGEVLSRALCDGADGHPDEVQFYRFASQDALDSYLSDPRRGAQAAERERVVARTELFPVRFTTSV